MAKKVAKKTRSVRKGQVSAKKFLEHAKKLESLAGAMHGMAAKIEVLQPVRGKDYVTFDGVKFFDAGIALIEKFIKKARTDLPIGDNVTD